MIAGHVKRKKHGKIKTNNIITKKYDFGERVEETLTLTSPHTHIRRTRTHTLGAIKIQHNINIIDITSNRFRTSTTTYYNTI